MGNWETHNLESEHIPVHTWSRSAARKSDLPLGVFRAYRPDLLCSPGFRQLPHWDIIAIEAENALRSLDDLHGDSASSLGWLLGRSESIGSSTIEGVSPSLRRVARLEAASKGGYQGSDRSALEALGNVRSTELAVALGKQSIPLSMHDLLDLHQMLMKHTGRPEIGGELRPGWVHVGGVLGGYPPPAYVAPPPDSVPELLDDLLNYVNESTHHPVVIAAVAHAQFESIHPFRDGNGRTGRALIQTILCSRGLTQRIIAPMSAVLATRRTEYIAALNKTRYEDITGDDPQAESFDEVVLLFSDVAAQSCIYAKRLMQEIAVISANWQKQSSSRRKHSAIHKILNVLPSLPVFTVDDIATKASIPSKTAYRAVRQLADSGIIEPTKGKYKGRGLFESKEILDLLIPDHERPPDRLKIDHDKLKPSISPSRSRQSQRDNLTAKAAKLRRSGLTHKEIGNRLGKSRSWAQKNTKGIRRGQ